MPRIPIYNPTGQIGGQAGSTDVPVISQQSTSGVVANQADMMSKSLQTVSDFANVLIKNESERIVNQEAIKYKTLLDSASKNIQTQLVNQPEVWMDEYEKAKSTILSNIDTTKYKYDFIKNQVTNQFELDYLPIRNTLFTEYAKQTKIQNAMASQETARNYGVDLGNNVLNNQEDFDFFLGKTFEQLQKHSKISTVSSTKTLTKETFTNAAINGLEQLYGDQSNLSNSMLELEDIDNENLLTILSYLDADDQEKIIDDFRDKENDFYTRQEKLENNQLKDNRQDTINLINELWDADDNKTRTEIYNKLMEVPVSYFGDDGYKIKQQIKDWHTSSYDNDNKEYIPQTSLVSNPNLVSKLEILIREKNLNFTDPDIFKNLHLLTLEEQRSLRVFATQERDKNSANFRKAIAGEFQIVSIDGEININLDSDDNDEQLILKQMASYAMNAYDIAKALEGEKFRPETSFTSIIGETKQVFKTSVIASLQELINNAIGGKGYEWLPAGTKAKDISSLIDKIASDKNTDPNTAFVAGMFKKNNQGLINMVNSYE
jgi:hypothetical protein